MPKPAFDRVERLFHEAVELSPERRAAFLDSACKGDRELRVAVEELLKHDQAITETDSFLISPVEYKAAQLRPTLPSVETIAERPNIPGYEILGDLGRGGMGVVYMARQSSLNRVVALKMLLQSELAAPEQIARFKSEAELLARLHHPNIIPIYDVGAYEGRPYFTMEFVNGPSLGKYQGSRPQPVNDSANLIEILARAMHVVHQHGIIHRDLKPSNILLQSADFKLQIENSDPAITGDELQSVVSTSSASIPKITDFGLAKDQAVDQNLTQTGMAMGTPCYMAPEQARSRPGEVGPAADIYSLGAILYEMLTGRPPFDAATSAETIVQLLHEPPPPPSRFVSELPRDIVTICLKCLEKEPKQRYASAWELAEDLRRFQADEPIHARPVSWVEQATRWCRRHPLAASLATLSGILGIGLIASLLVLDAQLREKLWLQTALAEKERKQIVQLNLIVGAREHEAGDLYSAALRFAEALRLDDAEFSRGHRERIAAALRECPRLMEIIHANRDIICSSLTVKGILAATEDANHNVEIRNITTGEQVGRTMQIGDVPANSDLSTDGHWLAAIGANGSVKLWNVDDGTAKNLPMSDLPAIKIATFSLDSSTLITKHADGTIRLWDLSSGQPQPRPLPPETRAPNQNESMRWHLVVDADGTGQLREIATGTVKGSVPLGPDFHRAIVSDAGDQVATVAKDQSVSVRQVSTGKSTPIIHRLDSPIALLQFSPDGKRLLVRDTKGTIRVWDVDTAKAVTPPMRNPGQMASIHFDADGQRLVLVEKSGEVRVWEMPGTSKRPSNQWDVQPEHRPMDELIALLKVHSHTAVNDRQEIEAVPTAQTKALTDKMRAGNTISKN